MKRETDKEPPNPPRDQRPEWDMGNNFPMYAQYGPAWRSIFTDVMAGPVQTYQGTTCARFEMNMMNCLEAYGYVKSHSKCQDYLHDFQECISIVKQTARYEEMQKERKRQWWYNERKNRYAPPPKMSSFSPPFT